MVVFDTIFSTVNQHGCSYAYVYLTFLGTSSEELSDAPVWQCMAMPAGNEAEDLGGPLYRLLGPVRTPFCTMEHLKRIAEEMQKQVAVAGAIQPKEENDLEFGCIM